MTVAHGIRIDQRDIAFLQGLGRYGLLSTDDAQDFYSEMKLNSVQKRLRLLTANGLTKTTRLRVWMEPESGNGRGGRIPTLHSLTPEGAALVETETGENGQRVLRSQPTAATFLHRREIVRVMRAFDLGCDAVQLPRPEWVMEQDPWRGAPSQRPPNQRRLLYHDFGNGLVCAPDLACRLMIGQTELALFWEIDLSTEGRKQLSKASKTDAYVRLFNERSYQRYWPDLITGRQYVLWVCPTERRLATMREVLKGRSIAPSCRFLTSISLASPEWLLRAPVWETIEGQQRAFFRRTPKASKNVF